MMYQVNSTYSDQQKQQQMVFATSSTPSPPPTVMPFLGCVGNACNNGKLPSSDGIDPDKLQYDTYKLFKLDKFPMVVGIVPTRLEL